jgi:hypothetical protein
MGRLERSGERLIFGEVATTTGQLRAAGVKSIVASGGELTAMADNQIMSLVRTSINQVANQPAWLYMKPTKIYPRNTATSQH